jgi:hypothetical protein
MSTSHLPHSIRSGQPLRRQHPDQYRTRQRRWDAVWRYTPSLLLRWATALLRFVCALRLEARSFVGRTRELLAKERWGADLGPLSERLPDGHLSPNRRTDARSRGIQELVSAYPWASSFDLQAYLAGFDAGERFALNIPDIPEHMSDASGLDSSPLPAVHGAVKSEP